MTYFHHFQKGCLLLWLTCSCSGAEQKAVDPADPASHYQVSIQDPSIRDLVKRYIAEHHLPAKQSVVFLSRRNDTESSTLHLSHTFQDISQGLKQRGLKQPMGYAWVDSSLVLVYAANYDFLLPKTLAEELAATVRRHGIVLKEPTGPEHFESWKFRQCEGQLAKLEPNTPALQGIPCGYVIELDRQGVPQLRRVNK